MFKEKFHETRVGRIPSPPYVFGSEAIEFDTVRIPETLKTIAELAIESASSEDPELNNANTN